MPDTTDEREQARNRAMLAEDLRALVVVALLVVIVLIVLSSLGPSIGNIYSAGGSAL
jgi:hypothetical protein